MTADFRIKIFQRSVNSCLWSCHNVLYFRNNFLKKYSQFLCLYYPLPSEISAHVVVMQYQNFLWKWVPTIYDKMICRIVDRRLVISFMSSRDYCQRLSLSKIFDTPLAGFEPVSSLSSDFIEWNLQLCSPLHDYITTPIEKIHDSMIWLHSI